MINKRKYLKNILTTASMLSVLAGGVQTAAAIDWTTTGVVNTNTGANANNAGAVGGGVGGVGGAALGVDDVLFITDPAHTVQMKGPNAIVVDLFGNNGKLSFDGATGQFLIRNTFDAGAIAAASAANAGGGNAAPVVNAGAAAAAARATIELAAAANYEINQDLISTIDLNGNDLTITNNSNNVNFHVGFESAAGNGNIIVDADSITFSDNAAVLNQSAFNGAAVGNLTINNTKSAILNTNLNLNANLILGTKNAANNYSMLVKDGKNITAVEIQGPAGDDGVLKFEGASDVLATIGTTKTLKTIQINKGIVDFQGTALNADIKATTIELNHAGAVMRLSTRIQNIEGDIKNTVGVDIVNGVTISKGGVLLVAGDAGNAALAHTITGKIGEAGNAIKAIRFANDSSLVITSAIDTPVANNIFADRITTDVDGTGNLTLQGSQTLNTIGADAPAVYNVDGTIKTAATNIVHFKNVTLNSAVAGAGNNGKFTLNANNGIYATNVNLAGLAANNILVLGDNTIVDGNVITANANNGIIHVAGNAKISGNIGKAAGGNESIHSLVFNVNDKTLKVGGSLIKAADAIGIQFLNAGTTLELTGNVDTTITADITNNGAGAKVGQGKIIANNIAAANHKLTITGVAAGIGTNANYLQLIEMKGGNGTLELAPFAGAGAYVNTIDMTGGDGTLQLNTAGNYGFALKHGDNQVTLAINNVAAVFAEGTKFSADAVAGSNATNPFKEMKFLGGGASAKFDNAINIYATNGITTDTNTKGAFTFSKGASIIDAQIGTDGQKFDTLTLTGNAAVANAASLDLKKDAYFNGAIEVGNNSTLTFGGKKLVANSITGKNVNEGTLVLNNKTGAATITVGNLAPLAALKSIQVNGGDVTIATSAAIVVPVNANTFTKAIEFTNKDLDATLTLPENVRLDAIEVSTVAEAGGKKRTLAVVGDQGNITGKIGTDKTHRLDSLRLMGDAGKATIGTLDFFAGLTSDKNQKAEVTLNKAGVTVYGIGSDTLAYKTVTFNTDGTIDGDTFSKTISVVDGKTATFKGSVTGETLTLGSVANGANAIFADGANLTTHAKTFTNDKSKLDFQGGGLIGKIGASGTRFEEVKFNSTANSAKTVMLTENIYSKDIQFAKSRISVDGNVTLNGDTATGVDTIIDLNKNQLTLETKAKLTGNVAINVNVARDNSHGKVIVANGAELDFTAVTSANLELIISIDDDSSIQDRSITVIKAEGTGDIKHSTTVEPKLKSTGFGNAFVEWTPSRGSNGKDIVLTSKDIAQEASKKYAAENKMDSTSSEFLNTITDKNSTGQAADLKRDLGRLLSKDPAKFEEATNRASNPIQNTSTVISELSSAVTSVVSSRISTVSGASPIKQLAGDIVGVAAGDESARFGAWGSPFYSQANQSNRKGISGYKAKSAGGTVGFDTMANDTLTVGVAATVARTDVKHKNIKAGDKTKLDTMMFSIYAMQNVTENWFAQGIASFGSSKVKNTEKHITSTGNESASGKYDSMSYGFEALGGYTYKVSDMAVVTPIFGLGYTKFNDSGYKQTGTTNRNFTINKKSTDKFEGILGARASFATDMNGIAVTPEVHAFVRQNLSSKTPKVTMLLDGAVKPLSPKAEKPAKTFFNVGTSVMAKSGMMEYGAGYDAHFANKYVGHTGTLKVRVNF